MLSEGTPERPLVVFSLDGQRYALDLKRVRRAIRVVAITPLPNSPAIVLGIVDLGGEIMPVIDLRARFNLPPKDLVLSEQLLIATTCSRTVALLVDETTDVVDGRAEEVASTSELLDGLLIDGAVRLEDGLILIHDLDRLLSLDEERAIGVALEGLADPAGGDSMRGDGAD